MNDVFCGSATTLYEYNEEYRQARISHSRSRVEAVSNTSTVTLRVVGSDEKGTQCLGI
jgi:hypothetical protein